MGKRVETEMGMAGIRGKEGAPPEMVGSPSPCPGPNHKLKEGGEEVNTGQIKTSFLPQKIRKILLNEKDIFYRRDSLEEFHLSNNHVIHSFFCCFF